MYKVRAEKALQILKEAAQGESISLLLICKRLQIRVKWIEGSDLPNGYAVVAGGVAYILLKSGQSKEECSATLAHELAHILLGHVGNWGAVRARELPAAQQENEACRLAMEILKAGK